MPSYYIRAIYNKLSRATHLQNVTTIGNNELDLLCRKYNYVAEEADHKGQKDALIDHFTNDLKIRNNLDLVAKLNQNANLLQQLIDYTWLLMAEPVGNHQIVPYATMYDPKVKEKSDSMLSHTAGGFKQLGVAFRGDNRSYAEFPPEGFVSRYSEPPGNRFHVPEVYGTAISQGMFYDRQNRDFLNQTGVCVARNFVGSMKFISSSSGGSYLYAVQFRTGADTEQYQQMKGGTALWRPGEKAASNIPKMDFLASIQCEITKKDDSRTRNAGDVWFQYRFLSDWVFHQGVDDQRQKYIKSSTFGRQSNVWYDFARGDDFKM